MVAVAHPGAVELAAVTLGLCALVAHWVVLRVLVFARAAQDPGALCYDEEEAAAGAVLGCASAAQES